MSDILERVQTARKAAIKIFLKEYAIHNLAKFMMETTPIMQEAVEKAKWLNFYNEPDPYVSNRMQAFTYRDLMTSLNADEDTALSSEFEKILKREGRGLHDQYMLLRRHYTGIQKLRDAGLEAGALGEDKIKARQADAHLQGAFDEGIERSQKMHERLSKDRKGEIWKPEVLVLQGGGAKGMSYAGVIQAMEDSGYLKDIKMVAGTSAGALIGLPVALGYNADEINQIVMKGRFAHFFAESTLKFRGLMKLKKLFVETTPEKTPHYEGDLLIEFTKNHFLPELARSTGITVKRWAKFPEAVVQEYLRDLEAGRNPNVLNAVGSVVFGSSTNLATIYEKAWASYSKDLKTIGRENDINILKFDGVPGRTLAFQAAITCIRLERPNRLDDGDIIQGLIGDLIQEKIKDIPIDVLRRVEPQILSVSDMRNLSFDQLRQLGEIWEIGNFKEFGVAATVSYMPFSLSNVVQLGFRVWEKTKQWASGAPKDNGMAEQDKNFAFKPIFFRSYEDRTKAMQSQMPIKKAVRASMNLPFLFKAMNLNGSRLVDGGINANLPWGLYRDRYRTDEEARDKMIGFMLSTVESDIEMKAIHHLASSENSVLMDIIESEFSETPITKPFTNALRHPISHFSKLFKKLISDKVESFMVSNNALPSLEALDNIGFVNTGMINTAQFNASPKERHVLRSQGANAFLDLTSHHLDKNLRYAMGRLVSLSSIENKLLMEKGIDDPDLQDPLHRLRDPDLLVKALSGERYEEAGFSSLIFRKEKAPSARKLPPHLVHYSPGFGI
jgi:predicted acylesterase/phospholipase RssA